jgi:FAD/FMN-containing dehydrogenase
MDDRQLERDLAEAVDGEVRFDAGTRAAYSTDASNFRQVPIGVVVPRTVDAAAAAVAVCRKHGAPLLSRGGGTSLAGQCTNTAVVIDWTKYCHRVVDNSCGATAQRTGKVVDNIAALEVLLYAGTRLWCGPASDEEYAAIERRGDRQASI